MSLYGPSSRMAGHRPLGLDFESCLSYVWGMFHLSVDLFTFGNGLVHLVYHVHVKVDVNQMGWSFS